MKSLSKLLLSVAMLGVIGCGMATLANPVTAEQQKVLINFERTVVMNDVLLSGQYFIVHDGTLMEQGKPCFSVYTVENNQLGKLVTTFYCERIPREKSNSLKLSYYGLGVALQTPIVSEIQFAGDTEAHRISTKHHH